MFVAQSFTSLSVLLQRFLCEKKFRFLKLIRFGREKAYHIGNIKGDADFCVECGDLLR